MPISSSGSIGITCNNYYNKLNDFNENVKNKKKTEENITKSDLDIQRRAHKYLNDNYWSCSSTLKKYNEMDKQYNVNEVWTDCTDGYNKIKEYNDKGIEYLNDNEIADYRKTYEFLYQNKRCMPEKNELKYNDKILELPKEQKKNINPSLAECSSAVNYVSDIEKKLYLNKMDKEQLEYNLTLNTSYTNALNTLNHPRCENNKKKYYEDTKHYKRDENNKVENQGTFEAITNNIFGFFSFSNEEDNSKQTQTSGTSGTSYTSTTSGGSSSESNIPKIGGKLSLPSMPNIGTGSFIWKIIFSILSIIFIVWLIYRIGTSRNIPRLIFIIIVFIIVLILYYNIGTFVTQTAFDIGNTFTNTFFPDILSTSNVNMEFWDNIWYSIFIVFILLFLMAIIRSVKLKEVQGTIIIWSLGTLAILFLYSIAYFLIKQYEKIGDVVWAITLILTGLTIIILIFRYFKLYSLIYYLYFIYGILCFIYIICIFIYLYKMISKLYDKICGIVSPPIS